MKHYLPLLLLGFLSACDDTDKEEDDSGGGSTIACADMDVDTCATTDRCATIDAREIQTQDGVQCVDFALPSVPRGCGTAELECGQAITYAAPPEDPEACWWFSSTCLPSGWVTCGGMDVGECGSR